MSRLGRLVEHDPRSLEFPAERATVLKSVQHHRHGNAFDQGDLGSCTGNAACGLIMSDPFYKSSVKLTEKNAVAVYSYATAHDTADGTYPPTDTGSSGLAAAKGLVHYGYCKGYKHAFGLQHALEALVLAPVMVGVNWYEGFDNPDALGNVSISGEVRGGHEFELLGLSVEAKTVTAINSWGPDWSVHGRFVFSWDDLDRLLSEDGDCTTIHN